MKTIYKIAAIFTLLTSMSSCSFLDVEPDSILAPENFYQTESEVIYGLTGIYGVMNNEAFYGNYYSLMIANTDDLSYQNRVQNNTGPYWYNHSSSDSYVYNCWIWIYRGIKNANEFMESIEQTNLDPTGKYIGEARFLRAYYYFLLAQAWGDVPLRTTAAKSPSEVQMEATPQKDILLWCVDEMEQSLTAFPQATLSVTPSRINRSTIQGILARVYLFLAGESVQGVSDSQAMWSKAAYWAKQVIDEGNHALNPNYSDRCINMIADKYDTQDHESMWEAEALGDRSRA